LRQPVFSQFSQRIQIFEHEMVRYNESSVPDRSLHLAHFLGSPLAMMKPQVVSYRQVTMLMLKDADANDGEPNGRAGKVTDRPYRPELWVIRN
jgi:hypothetical protein